MAKLKDVFWLIRNGASIKQTADAGGIPITRIETIANRVVDREKLGYAGICEIGKYADYILQDDDILMSHINSEKHLGKVAIYTNGKNEIIIHGMNLLMLRANQDNILPKYAKYYFETVPFLHQIKRIMKKSVNQASFTVTALKEVEIPLPTLEEQRRVAAILDKVSDLIDKRRQQLEKLDLLVKSQFIEMFGDIPKSQYRTIKDVCNIVTDGTHQPPKFVSEGIPFLLVSNIANNEVTYETSKFITEDTYNELIKRTPIEVGDILLSTVGSYGHPAIVKSNKKFCFQRHIAYLKPNIDVVDSVFLYATILSHEVQSKIDNLVLGVAQKTLNLSAIRSIEIPVPPMERQKWFCEIFKQADKSKFEIQKSLEKLETLKKALMQEYFG